MYNVAENITDDLISGSSVSEIEKRYSVKAVTLPQFDLMGNDKSKHKIKDKIFTDAYINKAIGMGAGDVSSIEEVNGNLLVFKVTDLKEAKQKSFNEVKSDLINIWISNKREDKTLEYISKIKQDVIKSKTSLSEAAKKYGLRVSKISVKYGDKSSVPMETINSIFNAKVGEINIKKESVSGVYRMYVIDNVQFPEKKNYTTEADILKRDLRVAMIEEYIYFLRKKYGFNVNENNLKSFINLYLN